MKTNAGGASKEIPERVFEEITEEFSKETFGVYESTVKLIYKFSEGIP